MSFFRSINPNVLGIDVSTSAVKLLELSKHGSRYRVESYAVAPFPENAVIDNNFADIEAIGQAVKTVVERSGTKLKQAAVSVSGSAVITKIITIPPHDNDAELEDPMDIVTDPHIHYS